MIVSESFWKSSNVLFSGNSSGVTSQEYKLSSTSSGIISAISFDFL